MTGEGADKELKTEREVLAGFGSLVSRLKLVNQPVKAVEGGERMVRVPSSTADSYRWAIFRLKLALQKG